MIQQTNKILLFIFVIKLALAPMIAESEVYKWRDSEGKLHYSDTPPKRKKVEKLDIQINSIESVTIEKSSLSRETGPQKKIVKKKSVVMYSTTWCTYCKKAARYFKKNNIPFKEYDVEASAKGKRDYKKLKGKGVPIILVGGRRMNGFSVKGFERLYQL